LVIEVAPSASPSMTPSNDALAPRAETKKIGKSE